MTQRLCKLGLVAALGLFFTLVGCDNIVDYDSNWHFVQHVLSMDTVFADSALRWRAVKDPGVQALAYWLIIGAELASAGCLWLGVYRMARALRRDDFEAAKAPAVLGTTLGLLLYMAGFVGVGGEWFAMWQSSSWNAQQSAFQFIGMAGLVLIVLLIPEPVKS
jgi:predicted small integral membrane protein